MFKGRAGLAPILAAAAFSFLLSSCSEGGCGGSPSKSSSPPPEDSGGMGRPSGAAGAGEIRVSRFDTSKQPKKEETAQAQAKTASTEASLTAAPQPLPRVGPADYRRKVLGASDVLLIVFGTGCPDCLTATPVLQGLASDFKGQYDFYQIDGNDPAAMRLLPPRMKGSPPSFVLFHQGEAASMRKGLPVKPKASEKAEDYQARLAQWFRDALISRDLSIQAQ